MAAQFPSTLPALIKAIEEVLPAVPAAVKAYRNLYRQRTKPTPRTADQVARDRKRLLDTYGSALPYYEPYLQYPNRVRTHDPVTPTPADKMIEAFARTLEQLPATAAALASLHRKTVGQVTTRPLYVVTDDAGYLDPDHVTSTSMDVVELGSGLSVPVGPDRVEIMESNGPYVPWWPIVPAEYAAAGGTVADCPKDALENVSLQGLAVTMPQLRGRAEGFDDLAKKMHGGKGPVGTARRTTRAANRRYVGWISCFEPLVPLVAAEIAARLNTTSAAIAALIDEQEGDFPMPVLASSAVVSSLASRIRAAIDSGHGGRLSVSDAGGAFAWQPAPGATLLGHLNPSTVTGRHATIVNARNAATVVGPVAEGGTKPTVVDFTSREIDLTKYAGLAKMSTESAQFVSNIEAAVSSVLVSQITRAIEKDAVTAITAEAGISITAAADMTAGVLAGIAGVRENGGAPTVVALASADWLEVMTATGGNGYLNWSSPEAGPGGTWLGLIPIIVPGMTAGTALVIDGSAVSVLEPAGGPLCVIDVYSGLSVNSITIAVEEWATTQVTSPGGVATVAVGP